MEKISVEDLKAIVSNLLEHKDSKKFNSIVDIGTFLWKVVHKIIETTKNENLKLQQKEDILVEVSGDVINVLEENGMITIELADKSRTLLKSVDTFLDVLIGLYSFVSVNEVIKNPTRENCIKSVFSILSCFSAKVDSQKTKSASKNIYKVEIIDETVVSGTGLAIENEKSEPVIIEEKVDEKSEPVAEEKVDEKSEPVAEEKVDEKSEAIPVTIKKEKPILTNSNILSVINEE
jgi:hypothetical protein